VQVYTLDPNKRTTYNLKLRGSVGAYKDVDVDFDVTVFDSCSSTIITPSSVNDFTYDLNSGIQPINFTDFTDSVGCGPFTYTLSMSVVPPFITLDATSKQINVNTMLLGDIGTYMIILRGE
jgi:hypothetical protein